MEEVNILSQKDKSLLLEKLEKECTLLIPQDKDRLGELQFHLFKYKGQNGNGKPQDYFFQIRMGIHQIFSKKHLPFCEKGDCIAKLESIIAANKKQIKNSIIDYCQNQLDTVLTVELEPEFNKRFPYVFNYNIKLCKARRRNTELVQYGWPSLCITIAWTDEFGEFQEFMHPITIDPETRCFKTNISQILNSFLSYRDTLI
jgi:hypothetical protein